MPTRRSLITGALASALYAGIPKQGNAGWGWGHRQYGFGGSVAADLSMIGVLTTLGLTTNLQLCLDAGDANSYTSGQSWLDRSGNGYDFFVGVDGSADSTDPTFNGTAGGLSSAEYFSVDGGDYFKYDSSNEAWMNNLHKNNALFTCAAFVYIGSDAFQALLGTDSVFGDSVGMQLTFLNNNPRFRVRTDTGAGANCINIGGDTDPANDAWHMVAWSINEAGGSSGSFLFLDGDYNQVSAADTFDAAYTDPSTNSANNTMEIMSTSAATSLMTSGSRIGCLSFHEGAALTKTNLDDIWTNLRGRFGI